MDKSLKYLPKLFFDKMIKEWMFEYVKVMYQFSNVVKWNKESDEMESMLIAREKGENIISYVDFSKICHVINCFPDLKKKLEKTILLLLSHQVQEPLDGGEKI